MVDNFAAFLSAAAESGQAVAWVEGALQVFSQLGDVVGSLVGIFQSIGQAATASGENMLGAFAGVLATLDEVLASSAGQDFLAGFFDTLNALGDALYPVIGALAEALAGLAPIISESLLTLGPALSTVISALGEGLAKDRKSTRLNSSHVAISYAVFCLKKKTTSTIIRAF